MLTVSRTLQIIVSSIVVIGLFGLNSYKVNPEIQEPDKIQAKVIHVNPGKAEKQSIAPIVSEVKYLRLQVPEDAFFGGIQKVLFRDSAIFILDASPGGKSKVFCFEMNGKSRYIIDKQGRGPGEYEYMYDIAVTDKYLVLSVPGNKLMYMTSMKRR